MPGGTGEYITDILIIPKGDKPPVGYAIIEKTSAGADADFIYKAGGRRLVFAYIRQADQEPITNLAIVFKDKVIEHEHGVHRIPRSSQHLPIFRVE